MIHNSPSGELCQVCRSLFPFYLFKAQVRAWKVVSNLVEQAQADALSAHGWKDGNADVPSCGRCFSEMLSFAMIFRRETMAP
mmetsp:Transcript_25812/g.39547  ORF Transcript_25812/g.39547 Transcript_25812/m.39547 type:complete len:82 (-) Transcript_25812:386-631(-)